jgi:hypothetical protein
MGVHIWGPNQGSQSGSQIGVPNRGHKSGPKSGSLIRVPNRGPKLGSQMGGHYWGSILEVHQFLAIVLLKV